MVAEKNTSYLKSKNESLRKEISELKSEYEHICNAYSEAKDFLWLALSEIRCNNYGLSGMCMTCVNLYNCPNNYKSKSKTMMLQCSNYKWKWEDKIRGVLNELNEK